jgi:hypothetical protein
MAAQDYTAVVEQLYISYFGRPADYYGLQNFSAALAAMNAPTTFSGVQAAVEADKAGTTALSKLVNSFNNSAESAALYGTDNTQVGIAKFVAAIYENVLGREADIEGFNFWVNAITSGALTKANAAVAITQGAMTNTTAQGKLDALTVSNKLAVATAFTTALDTPTEITAFSGEPAAAAARALLAGVNSSTDMTAAQADVATSIENIVAISVPGKTFELTTSIDNLIGTQGNDTFNTIIDSTNTAAATFGPLDVVDGGAGRDTLNIADTSGNDVSLGGLTLKSIETLAVSATGAFTAFDISKTGVTNAVLNSSATGVATITAADTTNVNLTVGAAAGTDVTVNGGKSVMVNSAGDNIVTGAKLTTVTVKGGTAAIDNTATAGSGAGTTLTSVTLDGVSGTNTVAGKGLTTVNLANIDAVADVTVTNATAAGHTLKLNVNAVDTGDAADVVVTDATAKAVVVTAASDSELTLAAAKATTLTVAGAGAVALDLTGSIILTSVDATAATGGVALTGAAGTVTAFTTGSGDDIVVVKTATVKDVTTTTNDETVNATVNTGAGDDVIIVNATGDGIVNVTAGEGDDVVDIAARGTAVLNVNLGAGDDTFTSTVAIGATDKIDAGDGTDMLSLALVGSANVGAFSNFDAFDAAGLNKALDVEILSQKNTVTEIVATGDVGTNASLINVGAGVGYHIEGSGTNALTITQKTAGDLTVTLDIDESGDDAATVAGDVNGNVSTNATGVKAVFDSSFVAKAQDATDNIASLTVTAAAAKTIAVVSGGDFASNVLTVGSAAALTSITVTGASHLSIVDFAGAKLASIDASAATGGLTASLSDVMDGGSIKLGSGADLITVTSASTVPAGTGATAVTFESIVGFEKTSATSVSASADATSKTALIADADMLSIANGSIVTTAASVTGGNLSVKGVLTFTGSGPSTLADAATIADAAVGATVGSAAVFEYLGNSYVFVQGGTADTLVQLTGVTGVTNLVEDGSSNHFFIV